MISEKDRKAPIEDAAVPRLRPGRMIACRLMTPRMRSVP